MGRSRQRRRKRFADASRGRRILAKTSVLIAFAIISAHVIAAAIVAALLFFVLPTPDIADTDEVTIRNFIATCIYVLLAVLAGLFLGLRRARPIRNWVRERREPTDDERRYVMRLPLRMLLQQFLLWLAAAVMFFTINVADSLLLAGEVALTIVLGGIASSTISYLLAERIAREQIALALKGAPPKNYGVPGVATKTLMAWAIGSGVPAAGVLLLGGASLFTPVDSDELARAALILTALGVVLGFYVMVVFARSIAEPLRLLRHALADVERGELDVDVPVTDSSQLGFVQAGFNQMVAGLREREKLHDLFGRHVGEDVARRALEEEIELGGAEREAAALFIDLTGSTELATQRRPTEVVEILNAFFEIVVDTTSDHGGFVNKFEGDAALCIFGAPVDQPDPFGSALAAGRDMCERLTREMPDIDMGIGISAGTVVAGNVGAANRFEYTVIGDPVNEAARLSELAKERDGRLIASEAVLTRAGEDEAGHWTLDGEVTLRGRSEATRLAIPNAPPEL